MVQDWGAATYSWDTSSLAAGTWQVQVWARQSGSSAVYESWTQKSFVLSATAATASPTATPTPTATPSPTACSSVSWSPSVASRRAVRSTNTSLATAGGT